MSLELEGKGAVVTGGGRGIGAAVAAHLAKAGARVVVAARTAGEIEAVAAGLRESGGEAWAVSCDVSDPASVEALVQGAHEHLEVVDLLVCAAGIADSAPVHKTELATWERLMAVNATGVFLCVKAFLPGMVERGWGRVVTVASVAGKMGAPYIAAYAASKHAVVGLTRAVAAEVAASGVTVNAVCPGYVDTPMTAESLARIEEKTGQPKERALAMLRRASPQHRLMDAEEVARMVAWLCAPGSKGVNGQALVLDGGALQS